MKKVTNSFVTGAVALVFAVLGYQTALLVHYSAVTKIAADRDSPDTVYVYGVLPDDGTPSRGGGTSSEGRAVGRNAVGRTVVRKSRPGGAVAEKIRESVPPARVESFRFDPNTVTVEEMVRLGFSRAQAQSIDRYRQKGGRFRRKGDFAKSYVVSDSLYSRLEEYIDIPLLDINKADSAAFDALPGIGKYFAAQMVKYRERLHGYSRLEQLLEIRHFDREKLDALKEFVTLSPVQPYALWELPPDSLRLHPYIGNASVARDIVFFREHNPRSEWTIKNLAAAGILSRENAARLQNCYVKSAE